MTSSKDISRSNRLGSTNYILYGSDKALGLFEDSPQTLMVSDNSDFDVVRCTPNNPITSLLDDFLLFERYLFIDANTYKLLHENLCQKMHKIISQPLSHLRSSSR
ncbi:hypothetical protein FGM00_14290 [Aggregatimonas sangjinii]|uniref:Uncharacterized protein n=1 Tax=Aggregatimonas sangjinii TaxID=2583587 RepID=A0A5B7SSN9_9FLAO|nr:hypothetical protein [Aggregatimonas sangjinii]QCX01222.1 hypothetical protein FGM00_14290 [Aggregatimonas sangjinii]